MSMKWLVLLSAGLLCADALVSEPSTDPNDYGLFRRLPDGCDIPTGCRYFAGLRVNEGNSSYLDVFLSVEAMGWVAIGFSESNSMQRSDVLGCNRLEGSGNVVVVDTNNLPGGAFDNQLDDPDEQDDIIPGTTEFENGRLSCTFSRLIAGLNEEPIDFNLDGDYFFLFGFGDTQGMPGNGGLARLEPHRLDGIFRPIILGQFNPVQDQGELPLPASSSGDFPDSVMAPIIAPADYRLRRRDPDDCDPESCDYFMGINTNQGNTSYLDFYLTAAIEGWVAVGFSRSANMFDADVLGCNTAAGSAVAVPVDTWNTVSGSRANMRDSGDDSDIVMYNSSFVDGRVTCIFSRRIIGADEPPQDRDLDRDYYLLYGLGNTGGGSGRLPDHGNRIPLISDGRFNPATDSGDTDMNPATDSGDTDMNPATDSGDIGIGRFTHGILMLIAWPLLAFTAILSLC